MQTSLQRETTLFCLKVLSFLRQLYQKIIPKMYRSLGLVLYCLNKVNS